MITPGFSLTSTERVLPKLALDFTTANLDARITFTRTTGESNPATYVASNGYIAYATDNQPRFDYTLNTGESCKGLLIEESRSNFCLYSNDLTNAAWTKTRSSAVKTATGPDNVANSASTLTATGDNAYVQQNITSVSAERVSSIYVKRNTGTGDVYFSQGETTGSSIVTNGDFSGGTTTGWQFVNCSGNASTNQLVVTASGANPNIRQTLTTVTGKVYKASINLVARSAAKNITFGIGTSSTGIQLGYATMSATGIFSFYFIAVSTTTYLSVSGNSAWLSGENFTLDDISVTLVSETKLTLTNDWARVTTSSATLTNPSLILRLEKNGDAVDVYGVQNEIGSFATSYIPTTTTALTRNADVATMTGTNFSDWYSAGAGGVVVRVLPSTVSGTRPVLQFDDATANEVIVVRGSTTNPELVIVDGGSPQAQIEAGTIAANTAYNLGAAWNTDNCAAAVNGGAAVTDTSATIPTVTQARIGSDGTNYANAWLQKINYWPQRITDNETQAFSK